MKSIKIYEENIRVYFSINCFMIQFSGNSELQVPQDSDKSLTSLSKHFLVSMNIFQGIHLYTFQIMKWDNYVCTQ